jgi:hypothetical protein
MNSDKKTQKVEESTEKPDLEERKKEFTKEFNELRKQYAIDLKPSLDFYEYKELPEEVKLSILVLGKHKARYIYELVEIVPNTDDN